MPPGVMLTGFCNLCKDDIGWSNLGETVCTASQGALQMLKG